jgi:hypothetical protein
MPVPVYNWIYVSQFQNELCQLGYPRVFTDLNQLIDVQNLESTRNLDLVVQALNEATMETTLRVPAPGIEGAFIRITKTNLISPEFPLSAPAAGGRRRRSTRRNVTRRRK